jgi:predicted transposase/invertase (TIGR01784 family)
VSDDDTHEILTNRLEIQFIELEKMRKFEKDSPITWWVEFFKNPHSEAVNEIGEFEPVIKEAVKMFDMVQSDPKTQEFLRIQRKNERDYNSAIYNAKMEEKRESALSMLADGMSAASVSKYTGLPVNEVQSLRSH